MDGSAQVELKPERVYAPGKGFRERCRMFPGLVNCCTIDWFTEWPADALQEVAKKQMEAGAYTRSLHSST